MQGATHARLDVTNLRLERLAELMQTLVTVVSDGFRELRQDVAALASAIREDRGAVDDLRRRVTALEAKQA